MHPTQIFLHNSAALRAEFRLDDARLILWWSPRAGESHDCADRNFSSRDNPLSVFEDIALEGFALGEFQRCDYDPFHCVLHYARGRLHFAIHPDHAALVLWADVAFAVDLKTGRYDERLAAEPALFAVRHPEPTAYAFEFAAALGAGAGAMHYSAVHASWNSHYVRAALSPGQLLVLSPSLAEAPAQARASHLATSLAALAPEALLAQIETALVPVEALGRVHAPAHPDLEALRRVSVRALHSMIDRSGAFRASIKAIYYLIWVRDSGFSFGYQAAAGWPHRLAEVCRFLLANPTTAVGEGVPPGRFFGQLANRTYGKYEEDGTFYVTWLVFTHWTQTGRRDVADAALPVLRDAMDWVERRAWDAERGLFGNFFGDETPAHGSRDMGHDYAIGKPGGTEHMAYEGQPVLRSYDIYFNLLQHSAYAMLAALTGERVWLDKAERLWSALAPFLETAARSPEGLPDFGELLLADGRRARKGPWGPTYASSIYPWALALPGFAPVPGLDAIRAALLKGIFAAPAMHFLNGVNAAIAAVDPWLHPEDGLVAMHREIAAQSARPGKFLPMGGAMPEKYDAPEGNLYHDIRPQGFAMGSWLAAFAGLAVRRLPHGLALRPSRAVRRVEAYPWHGYSLELRVSAEGPACLLRVGGAAQPHTLQIPHEALAAVSGSAPGSTVVELAAAPAVQAPLLLRSTVELLSVRVDDQGVRYALVVHGVGELAFAARPASARLMDPAGTDIPATWTVEPGIAFLRFAHFGAAQVIIPPG
jgi:hypothetical protein